MDEADVRLIVGEQGSGKTTTGVALPVDDYYANVDAVISPNGERISAATLTSEEQEELEAGGVIYDPFHHVKIFNDDNSESKIIKLPDDFMIASSVKIFSNFTFYGVRYVPADLIRILEYVNSDFMTNAWIIMDESIMTDKRETMTVVGKLMSWFGAQARRRNLHMVVISQYLNMIQSRFNLFAKTRVLCTYDKETRMVNLEVNNKSPVMQSTSYYAPNYWAFFKHDEIVRIPQGKIDKAIATLQDAG